MKDIFRRLRKIEARHLRSPKACVPSWLMGHWRSQAEAEGMSCEESEPVKPGGMPTWLLRWWERAGLTSMARQ
jgi:hypothetical protein